MNVNLLKHTRIGESEQVNAIGIMTIQGKFTVTCNRTIAFKLQLWYNFCLLTKTFASIPIYLVANNG